MGDDISRLRQRLSQILDEQSRQLELLLCERGPLLRGPFGTRARRCGAANCRCTRGELHVSKYLTASDGGRGRQVHVPGPDEAQGAAAVERHRRFGQGRDRLAELAREQLELVDRLGRSLLGAYPPGAPFGPPRPRGRPPAKERKR